VAREPIEVPLLDLRAEQAKLRPALDAALARVLDSQRFILGPEAEALESEIAALAGAGHAVACASGSDALLLCLMALGVGPGDEVVVPTYTFFATASAVHRLGARPVFVDVDPATYDLDPAGVAGAAERCERLRAVIPVHLYGQAADLDALEAIARGRGVPLIEDAAQAIGALDARGRPVGGAGWPACFSFYPTKNLGGYGDGGIITTSDAALADELRGLRDHGMRPRYHHRRVGICSRLDAFQAAVLRVKLPHLDGWNETRRANADHYDSLFGEAGALDSRNSLDEPGFPLRFPARRPAPARHVFHQYVIRVPARLRDALRQHLTAQRIGTEVYYPIPLHLQECFASLGYREGDLPHAERAARETLAIPVHPELSKAQREHVVTSVVGFLRASG
jgi:dTDP-4-amino-4,6-dideoxygalactose transaminase